MTSQEIEVDPPRRVRLLDLSVVLAGMLATAAASIPAECRAAESVVPITPPGSTDTDQAILPPGAGLYIGAFALPYSTDRHTYDSKGHTNPEAFNIHINTQIYGAALLYVYPFKLFGGTLGSTFVQPVQNQTTSIGNGPSTTQFGLSDAFSDIVFWSKNVGLLGATPGNIPMPYGLTVGAAFSLIVPDGAYEAHHIFKLSSHTWVPNPNVSFTYNTGPKLSLGDNTQISTRLFYAFPQRQMTTGYMSGNILDLDWSATEQFGKLRAGVAGYYQTQTTDDHTADGGSFPNGNKFSDAAIGPVLEYFIPKWGAFVKAKYLYTFYHKNYVDEDLLVLSTGFKF